MNSTIGPSAPPIIATDAASRSVMPNQTAIGKVATVPSSANSARIMLWNGRAMTKPTSSSTPIPMNTRQAMRPLLNMKV